MNSRSIVALILYVTVMTGITAVIAKLGAAMARQAAGTLLLAERPDPPVSRVERGLEAQARVTDWEPVSHVVELHAYSPSEVSAVVLASAMDKAEDVDLSNKVRPRSPAAPAVAAKATKPRVAGWIRRAVRVPVHPGAVSESTAQLIQRHLRAEM
ncbi:MAG: hypothetical protein WC026_10365 [Hyphomicrobium sp.]|uniref:hypothetical protein n=1 Tax=Hyphomicrobium sp. TaxID=82 RepID=UPI0035656DE8